jgi:ferrous iron transport protein A
MSPVSELMRQRTLASADPHTSGTLADLRRGESAVVVGYGDTVEPGVARRLFDLGLVPGVQITMVRRAPLGDPAVYRVGDYEIALRRSQSRCVGVAPVR